MERFVTVAQQSGDSLDLVQQGELAGWVVPLAGVEAIHSSSERGERLHLQLGLPPTRPDRQPVACP